VTLEHDVCGSLRLGYDDADLERLAAIVAGQRARGLDAELWDASRLAREEPALAPCAGAACFAGDGVVDPPRLLEAARAAVERAGAVWTRGLVRDVILSDGRCRGAVLDEGSTLAADEVIVCAGSWSGTLQPLPIEPVRGQLFELRLPAPPIRRVVEGDEAYLSRRADGRVLVGSTEERVGFERAVTAAAAARLLPAAVRMVPALGAAQLTGSWCGFRAGTPDTLPILGRAAPGLVLATGHFRNGIVLAPITGAIVAAICTGEPPPVDLAPFDVRRFGGPNGHVS
jgi:glycine oxidase